ncbi:hypothetical protein B0H13DRAFT_2309750 [Mycena leptocephala]|nr:hypothetical protein B0H13DRAFT_2309750 [Mycena leptocephala]
MRSSTWFLDCPSCKTPGIPQRQALLCSSLLPSLLSLPFPRRFRIHVHRSALKLHVAFTCMNNVLAIQLFEPLDPAQLPSGNGSVVVDLACPL